MRPLPVALMLTLACSAAYGQPQSTPRIAFQDVDVARNRGVTSIRLRGPLPPAVTARAPLSAQLTRGSAVAVSLTTPVELESGVARIRFRTARLLMNGRYTVRLITEKKTVACTALVQVGSNAEVVAARDRLMTWYGSAAGTLRGLSSTLERRGRFHLALLKAKRPVFVDRFKRFQEDWERALRVAAMDLATYRRRLLLPFRPEIGRELRALLKPLRARHLAWRQAILGETSRVRGVDPGPNTAILAGAARLLKLLNRPRSELADWRAGPLGRPPAVPKAGAEHEDPLGFSLPIPAGARVAPPENPVDRVQFQLEGVNVVVRVIERPDDATPEELRQAVELGAWERWDSYKRRSGKPLPSGKPGLRLEYSAQVDGKSGKVEGRVIELARFPAAGRRTVSLILIRPRGVNLPPALKALEESW